MSATDKKGERVGWGLGATQERKEEYSSPRRPLPLIFFLPVFFGWDSAAKNFTCAVAGRRTSGFLEVRGEMFFLKKILVEFHGYQQNVKYRYATSNIGLLWLM